MSGTASTTKNQRLSYSRSGHIFVVVGKVTNFFFFFYGGGDFSFIQKTISFFFKLRVKEREASNFIQFPLRFCPTMRD